MKYLVLVLDGFPATGNARTVFIPSAIPPVPCNRMIYVVKSINARVEWQEWEAYLENRDISGSFSGLRSSKNGATRVMSLFEARPVSYRAHILTVQEEWRQGKKGKRGAHLSDPPTPDSQPAHVQSCVR